MHIEVIANHIPQRFHQSRFTHYRRHPDGSS